MYFLYLGILLFIAIFFINIMPIFITSKIYKLELPMKKFFSLVGIILFFPISIFFCKNIYLYLKDNNKIIGLAGFIKILCTIFAFVIIIGLLLFSILSYFIQPVQQNGQSMFPAIYDRQFLLAHNFVNNYKRGDIILFKNNDNLDIKRIIGLPNEELKIDDGKVFIYNGTEYQELDEIYLNEQNKNSTRVRGISEDISYYIPDGMYFVMGDNRQYSTDSRTCFSTCREGEIEFLAREDILGKVYFDLGYFNFETRAFKHPVFLIPTYPRFFNID